MNQKAVLIQVIHHHYRSHHRTLHVTFYATVEFPVDVFGVPTKRHTLHEIRTVTFADKPNDPWFVAADVCKALGLYVNKKGQPNVTMACYKLSDDEKGFTQIETQSRWNKPQRQKVVLISESGLYKPIMRSDKPQGQTDWTSTRWA